ncbi:cytochrome P450 [Antrihabitans stalactiti]|uniref:Cytochrome P450 n=1 Tax=Antrihabitans stalactiti TaxID=2584121 RepID=A0A848KSB7_9NOCA|nr:cytochrome P450 [Antrihabitans stalactiti]NMN99150.1 cytochrome P450 [Antrihabitans stalactiti]
MKSRGAPVVDLDLYSGNVIRDPQPIYRTIRDAGPLVWLPKQRLWAMGRFDDVREALRDDTTFRSGRGVAANPIANMLGRYTTLSSDDQTHLTRRRILMHSLTSRALAPSVETFEHEAVATVERLLELESFEAVADFSSRLPVQAVAELVGLTVPPTQMLTWAAATFDGLGPANQRTITTARSSLGLLAYTLRLNRNSVTPGGWAASVFDAADRGDVGWLEAKNMVVDFVAPSLDTTILATAQMLWSLGTNPDVWQQLKDDPSLVPTAVVEAVRIASPIRGFTRTVADDTTLHGVPLRKGDRVVLLYAAANMDERHFDQPERFALYRRGSNLGWGHGIHTCVGMQLAKLEMQTLLHAMIPRVDTITVSDPKPLTNNCLQGFASFTARFT